MTYPKLSLQQVTRRFGSMTALAPTNLDIQQGEFVCIVGPSGCGKSTLFNLVSGVLTPDSGKILIDNQNVTGTSGHVGYMLQKDLLLPWMTVIDNIVLGAILKGGATKAQRAAGVALAQRYGLGEFIHHYPAALSGGMRQRVALMRTLAMQHEIMLLDEPFGALDSQTRLSMQQWLLTVWSEQQRTVIFVTHDIDEAVYLADRVVVMSPRPGRVREILTVDIPRPRPLSCLTSPEFTVLKRKILDLVFTESHADQDLQEPLTHD
ncbi:ABC transporter ATP-binding protein [Rouxiella badensis]|jgi:ABC-type nitrate/sulfonate/bicarbonate transport system ATPase subunit|uniref:Nitrate ABC transporter ATP-binding protein n=1 Tax=Rouxiella badensis TaxID=1646377 RepID=A0A1X0WH22_9GAMM|nr:ABC transporter ATP-binding protein [Rouxiella badensis]MCC3701956.1 ABC transporter ATP-binding protein [Rouxiella badensis]MCC3718114.1 ABC transporter ATP-binding protein [Rouxiella badensis]MCC3727118.1 ABC transporter ATP-binding protein [Rouxiella badensis]MCC3731598.1 ABC transporter ATP-binding protein [Rouxiella badensis]MCC3738533.1 ABC transporter ATP-binding protein [Rouxiella badensis]